MKVVSGKLVKIDDSKKIVEFEISRNGEKKTEKFYVEDAELLNIIKKFAEIDHLVYEERDPYPVIKSVKGKISLVVHGAHKSLREKLKSFGELKSYLSNSIRGLDMADLPIIGFGDDLFGVIIVIIFIVLLPLILAAIYYLLIVPLLIMILTIFTLGEAYYMMWRKILVVDFDTNSEESIRKIKELALNVGLSKGALENLPDRYLPRDLTEYLKSLLRIYKLFWNGIVVQTIAIILFGLIFAINRYMGILPHDLYFNLEIGLALIFLAGFVISIIASYLRRFTEIPLSIKLHIGI